MGLFEKVFPRKYRGRIGKNFFEAITAYRPAFRSWGGKMYESELIRAAIDAKARHISKLRVEFGGNANGALRTNVRQAPNPYQTWSQFLYRLSTIYSVYNTAFIVPSLDQYGQVIGYYTVLPENVEIVDVYGEPWLRYHFANGKTGAMELSRCGVMTNHQYKSDFFGESNEALNGTLRLLDMQQQGIVEGIKNSATYRFMASMTNFASPEDMKKERKQFSEENLSGENGGLLLFPNRYKDIKQIDSKPYLVDAEQIKLIQTNVFNYFGVNEKVLQNSAIGDELDAFFDGAIEPFAILLSEVMTNMTFSKREQAQGNRIAVTANRMQYMSTSNKIAFMKEGCAVGMLMIDEIRELFNYDPLPDGKGQRVPYRGEYHGVGENDNSEDDENGEN